VGKKGKGGRGGRGATIVSKADEFFKGAKGRNARIRQNNANQIDVDRLIHALKGDMRPNHNGGTGYHYRPGGKDWDGRRIEPGSQRPVGNNGVYEARPGYQRPDGTWQPKAGNNGISTFFPDDWTPSQVNDAISRAYRNSAPDPANPNSWIGHSNGVRITGFYDNNKPGYTHGYPHANQDDVPSDRKGKRR
jgi:hypothetical protein